MSEFTKKKHVIKEITKDLLVLPTPDQIVAKVLTSRGNNLHEVEDATGDRFLVSMPTKFRRNVWINRKSFVLVEPIDEGVKVRAEIITILTQDHISYFNEEGVWPKAFAYAVHKRNSDDIYKTGYDPLKFVNFNRVIINQPESSSSESDESSEEDNESVNSDEEEVDENNHFPFINESHSCNSDSENSSTKEDGESEKSDELKDENSYLSNNKSNSDSKLNISSRNEKISSEKCDIKNDTISE